MVQVKRELKVIEAGGTPYEIGFQYGLACPEIRTVLDSTYERTGLAGDAVASLVQKYIPFIRECSPETLDEFKGIAEGAKVSFDEILFFNCPYETLVPLRFSGCTSFAARGSTHDH